MGRTYFHILLKWGIIIKFYGGEKFQKMQYDPPPTIKHRRVHLEAKLNGITFKYQRKSSPSGSKFVTLSKSALILSAICWKKENGIRRTNIKVSNTNKANRPVDLESFWTHIQIWWSGMVCILKCYNTTLTFDPVRS